MDLESIIATRVSLLRSARQREQREQIGILQSDLTRNLINLERRCLVQLSEAAREAKQPQIALNSIVRALRLEPEPSPEVSQEFANVLWLQNEQKYAVEFLRRELENRTINRLSRISNRDKVQKALTLAKLVSANLYYSLMRVLNIGRANGQAQLASRSQTLSMHTILSLP